MSEQLLQTDLTILWQVCQLAICMKHVDFIYMKQHTMQQDTPAGWLSATAGLEAHAVGQPMNVHSRLYVFRCWQTVQPPSVAMTHTVKCTN